LNTLGSHIRLLTAISALTPFWNSQTGYWASSETTATNGLHYSYPEFNDLNLGDLEGVKRAISIWITQNYGGGQFSLTSSAVPAVNLLAQPPPQAAASAPAPAPAAQGHEQSTLEAVTSTVKSATADIVHQFHSRGPQSHGQSTLAAVSSTAKHAISDIAHQIQGHGTHPHPPLHGQHPTVIYDWAARIHTKKYELGDGYVVLIFLGEVPDDPSQWRTCPSFVGAHVSFVNTDAEKCANCRDQADLVVEGFVHLNAGIAKRSGLSSYEPSVVTPYLRDNMHWRVQAVCSFRLP
jgi:tyrosinase